MVAAAARTSAQLPPAVLSQLLSGQAESAGLKNREESLSALLTQCAVPSGLVGHSAV